MEMNQIERYFFEEALYKVWKVCNDNKTKSDKNTQMYIKASELAELYHTEVKEPKKRHFEYPDY